MLTEIKHYCKKCGHQCHCNKSDCPDCINDVCTSCDCGCQRISENSSMLLNE